MKSFQFFCILRNFSYNLCGIIAIQINNHHKVVLWKLFTTRKRLLYNMVPKIIHYCWFGRNPLPPLALECIASWRKFFPDYEIKEWNEDNFDVNMIPYTKEAYEAKKYAFVSDYARFWILYHYGGLYFDTDVEVIGSLSDILEAGPFMGFERNPNFWEKGLVNPGLGLALAPQMDINKQILTKYEALHFILADGSLNTNTTVVHYTTDILAQNGLKERSGIQIVGEIHLYPADYFAPISFVTNYLHLTKNTKTIHRYMASWKEQGELSLKNRVRSHLPEFVLILINRIKNIKDWKWFR